ncbi:MAG: GTP-binding protein [Saprospiraceae bacterium]|nr:GTP-binding protein [Saprospiraceae bacterium]
MTIDHLDPQLVAYYSKFSGVLTNLKDLTEVVGHQEMMRTVGDMTMHLETPYMFVIVGEVKAGKSSFINALLRAETDICKVAPSPMTDTIQQIVYGPEVVEHSISSVLKRISHPEEILKQITIVDTPGTNTVIDHHQEITEQFIPHADLIVFVFEAKNPYRQSAWEFFDYINADWHKNIIFVLQQKDLMNDDDLKVNIKGVSDQARNKGVQDPKVFAVSAKEEKEGKSQSGYQSLRTYIDDKIVQGNAAILKLRNNITTADNINSRIGESIALRNKQYDLDKAFREEIRNTLLEQEEKTNRQIDILTENLIAAYDQITYQKIDDLTEGLSVLSVLKRAFSSIFGGDKGLKVWLEDQARDFELKLNKSLKSKLQDGIVDVSEDIQMMGKMVNAKITTSKTVLKDSDEIFADIAERRAHVLGDLQKSFRNFLEDADNFYDNEMMSTSGSMAPNLAAGGGMAVIGVILSTAINGAVFDITGGILTAVGVLFASVSVGWKRSKVIRQFKEEVKVGREKIREEVTSILKNYTQRISRRIDGNFYQLDNLLKEEEETLKQLNNSNQQIKGTLIELSNQLDNNQ